MLMKRLLTIAIALPLFAAALLLLPQNLWALFLLPGIVIGGWEWGGLAGYTMPGRVGFSLLVPASALALLYITSHWSDSASLVDMCVYAASAAFCRDEPAAPVLTSFNTHLDPGRFYTIVILGSGRAVEAFLIEDALSQ